MTYRVTRDSITGILNGKPIWKATVKKWNTEKSEGGIYRPHSDLFLLCQREYHGFSE